MIVVEEAGGLVRARAFHAVPHRPGDRRVAGQSRLGAGARSAGPAVAPIAAPAANRVPPRRVRANVVGPATARPGLGSATVRRVARWFSVSAGANATPSGQVGPRPGRSSWLLRRASAADRHGDLCWPFPPSATRSWHSCAQAARKSRRIAQTASITGRVRSPRRAAPEYDRAAQVYPEAHAAIVAMIRARDTTQLRHLLRTHPYPIQPQGCSRVPAAQSRLAHVRACGPPLTMTRLVAEAGRTYTHPGNSRPLTSW
jgi:hypothetical protein